MDDQYDLDVERFCAALAKDKKNVGEELRLILCKGYGKVFKTPVRNDELLHNWLVEYFDNEFLNGFRFTVGQKINA